LASNCRRHNKGNQAVRCAHWEILRLASILLVAYANKINPIRKIPLIAALAFYPHKGVWIGFKRFFSEY
jgi:hypothetical protein